MKRLLQMLLLVSAVSAFTTTSSSGSRCFGVGVTRVTTTKQFMFSKDDDDVKPALPLSTTATSTPSESSSSNQGSIVKDMNTGEIREVKWQDPAMLANTNLVMDWWAALLIAVPSTLILDDFFHFLPKGIFLVH